MKGIKRSVSIILLAIIITNLNSYLINASELMVSQNEIKNYQINQLFDGTSLTDVSNDISDVNTLSSGAILLKFKTSSASSNMSLLSFSDTSSTGTYVSVSMRNGSLRYEVKINGTQKIGFQTSGKYNDNAWHTALINIGTQDVSIYMDGIKLWGASLQPSQIAFFNYITAANNMSIGGRVHSGATNGTEFFNGNIEYIKLFNQALSADIAMEITDFKQPVVDDYNKIIEILNGDESANIVFAGDSITHGPLHTKGYRSYSEHFNERIRGEVVNGKQHKEHFVINVGVSSGTSQNIVDNFESWIKVHNPEIVFITIGMNDATSLTVDKYRENIKYLVDNVRELGAIPILQTSNTVKGSRGNLNAMMDVLREVSIEKQVFLIDHQKNWLRREAVNTNLKNEWLNDSIHPNEVGHLEMAKLIFKELGLDEENSYTNNLSYPINVENFKGETVDTFVFPSNKVEASVKPVVNLDVNKRFFGMGYLDYDEHLDTVKNLNKGSIVARFNLTTSANAQTILSMSDSRDESSNLTLAVNGGRINYSIRENGNITINVTSNKLGLNDGNWHTVVVSTNETGTKIYIDGVLDTAISTTTFFNYVNTPDSLNVARNEHQGGNGEWYYNGGISYVDIYDTALQEVDSILISKSENYYNRDNISGITNLVSENAPGSWVFLGDDATAGKGDTYGFKNYTEYVEERLRWELNGGSILKRQKFVINSGVSGATSTEILQNINKWALDYNPKAVFVMIGGKEKVSVEEFEDNMRSIIEQIKLKNAVPVLMTPTIQKNDVSQYANVIRNLSKEYQTAIVDFYYVWTGAEKEVVERSWLTEDYNPNHLAHYDMAIQILKHFNMYSTSGVVGTFNISKPGDLSVEESISYVNSLITEAETLIANTTEGNDGGQYILGSQKVLQANITSVKEELKNTTITIDMIKALKRNISDSLIQYKNSKNYYKEDFNKDDTVDILDLSLASAEYNNSNIEEIKKVYDLNGDGIIDIFDLVIISKRISS